MLKNELTFKNIKDKSLLLHTSPENILREELQKCVLYLLAESAFFTEGVFQGGTALRIVYENIRYSEDLDFVFQCKNSATYLNLEPMIEKIPNKLKKWFPYLHVHNGKWQKQSDLLKRYQFISSHPKLHAKLMLQLEFANIPSYHPSVSTLQWNMFMFPLRTETEKEILADKLVAFGLRAYLKGRDLWDMHHLIHVKKISVSPVELQPLVQRKILDYGYSANQYYLKFRNNLELLKNDGMNILDNEMKRFMSQNIYTAYTQEFASIVQLLVEDLEKVETMICDEY